MRWYLNLSLGNKIVVPLLIITIVAGISMSLYFSSLYRKTEVEALVTKARAVELCAEATRESVADQHQFKVFKTDLREVNQILRTVPIFAAMQVAEKKSKDLGFTFKVPKVSPRNPKNEPDEYERKVLATFAQDTLSEVWHIDEATNEIRFFRPVRLTPECLSCHGDPKNSFALWGNREGKDPTGSTMENWKVGEVHGAFEVMMSLGPVDAAVRQKSAVIAGISAFGVLLTIIVGFFISKTVANPVKLLAQQAELIAKGDLTVEVSHRTNDEIGQLAGSFRTMVRNLREAIGQVTEASSAVEIGRAHV